MCWLELFHIFANRNSLLHFLLPLKLPTRALWTGRFTLNKSIWNMRLTLFLFMYILKFGIFSRTKFVREIYQSMEQGLTLVGATGIEDRLQDKVSFISQIFFRLIVFPFPDILNSWWKEILNVDSSHFLSSFDNLKRKDETLVVVVI